MHTFKIYQFDNYFNLGGKSKTNFVLWIFGNIKFQNLPQLCRITELMPVNNSITETLIISTFKHFTAHLVLQDTSLHQNHFRKTLSLRSTGILVVYKGAAITRILMW